MTTALFSSELHWAKDFASGVAKAQKEKKPIMFIFSRTTCKYCVILEKTTLSDDQVVTALNRDYVSIVAYSDKRDAMPQELWRPGTPTIWFLDSTGRPMFEPLVGAVGKEYMLQVLSVVKKAYDKNNKKVQR